VPANSITKTKGISEPSKSDPTKIVSQFDGMSVAIEEKKELNEYGVYNSETDINNNPKTGENKPAELTAFFGKVIERLKDITTQLAEVNDMIKENDSISPKSIEICVAELETYVKSLEDESEVTNTSGVE